MVQLAHGAEKGLVSLAVIGDRVLVVEDEKRVDHVALTFGAVVDALERVTDRFQTGALRVVRQAGVAAVRIGPGGVSQAKIGHGVIPGRGARLLVGKRWTPESKSSRPCAGPGRRRPGLRVNRWKSVCCRCRRLESEWRELRRPGPAPCAGTSLPQTGRRSSSIFFSLFAPRKSIELHKLSRATSILSPSRLSASLGIGVAPAL